MNNTYEGRLFSISIHGDAAMQRPSLGNISTLPSVLASMLGPESC
jgi:hypothetical protein